MTCRHLSPRTWSLNIHYLRQGGKKAGIAMKRLSLKLKVPFRKVVCKTAESHNNSQCSSDKGYRDGEFSFDFILMDDS